MDIEDLVKMNRSDVPRNIIKLGHIVISNKSHVVYAAKSTLSNKNGMIFISEGGELYQLPRDYVLEHLE